MNNLISISSNLVPSQIFKEGGTDSIINSIREEINKFIPDTTTTKGRKEISSLAYKISRSKTFLDTMGKELKAEYSAMIKPIDTERRKCRDELDLLRDQVRLPLDEWEEEEKRKKEEKKFHLDWDEALIEDDLFNREREIQKKTEALRIAEEKRKEEEFQKQEQERIEREKIEAEKQRKIREEQIRKETQERLKREQELNEQKLKDEYEQKMKLAQEEAERKLQEKLAAERRQVEDEKRKKLEEETRIKREQELKEREEQRIRENIEHRQTINNLILKSLIDIGIDENDAKRIINAIYKNEIPNVFIQY